VALLERMLREDIELAKTDADLVIPFFHWGREGRHFPEPYQIRLAHAAIESGAARICLADTVGHATPAGVWNLVHFIRGVVSDTGRAVKIDWHGHNDRGLGLINSLTAASAGVNRVHGTAMGLGERVGNAAIDQLLVNFRLLGWFDNDLRVLGDYCDLVSRTTGFPIPCNYPVVGADAFRTATGVHAAAVVKAMRKGDEWLANRIYSGVPADHVGRRQSIEIGPMSGQSNVQYWLEVRGFPPDPDLISLLFARGKEASRLLTEQEVLDLVHGWQGQPAHGFGSMALDKERTTEWA